MRFRCALAFLCLSAVHVAGAELRGSVQVSGKPAPFVVVWLEAPGAPPYKQTKRVTLDQKNLAFDPGVLVVRVGTVVDFPNTDKVFHNVFSFHDGKKFDLGMYPVGTSKPVLFNKEGLSRIFCNIHPHMAAYVMAVDSPYYALSDGRGAFAMPDVPAGSYTYHAWRPGGETLTGTVTVDATHTLEVNWK